MEGKSIDINKIHIIVTCPACHKTYGIQLKAPRMRRNCNCMLATFYIQTDGKRGKGGNAVVEVHVKSVDLNGIETVVIPDEITVAE